MSAVPPIIEPILIDRAGLKTVGVTFSNAWLLDLEARGLFPRRLSVGGRKTCWLLAEVRFIAKRAADRDVSAAERRRATRPSCVAPRRRIAI